ncbi:hypothetical protein HGRIS_005429 [Hohenbuehelia grisea]|uniref:Uncharacterized protein n=1 Tax=Hohenbuehelia grisea TaxID=104357 RepID=A0ABR3JZ17_9AGAR
MESSEASALAIVNCSGGIPSLPQDARSVKLQGSQPAVPLGHQSPPHALALTTFATSRHSISQSSPGSIIFPSSSPSHESPAFPGTPSRSLAQQSATASSQLLWAFSDESGSLVHSTSVFPFLPRPAPLNLSHSRLSNLTLCLNSKPISSDSYCRNR